MRRIGLVLGVMTLITGSFSPALADDQPLSERRKEEVTFDIECRFRSSIKGYERCEVFAKVFALEEKDEHNKSRRDDLEFIEGRKHPFIVVCNDNLITDGKGRVNDRRDNVIIYDDGVALKLDEDAFENDRRRDDKDDRRDRDRDDEEVVAAWLKIDGTVLDGVCEVERKEDRRPR